MGGNLQWMRTRDLRRRIGDDRLQVIDVRSADAYNGWRRRGEKRGGHLPGARSLPAKWAGYIDWIEIVQSKGLRPDRELLIYGDDRPEIEKVGNLFAQAGYPKISLYDGFPGAWNAVEDLPLQQLPRYRHLVPPEWVYELAVKGNDPETGEARTPASRDYAICHAHYRNRPDFEKGHIPGAVPLDTNWLESPETWNRRSADELKRRLEAMGISHDTTVVLYGRFSNPDFNDPFPGSSAGHLGAFRCAVLMMYSGVRDVRVLNGGLQSWEDAGFPLASEESPERVARPFGAAIPGAPELMTDLEEAKGILRAADSNLVCVRSWREFIGEVSGYNYIEMKGRIPGAVFADCGSDAYHMESYRNLDHTCREYHEIEHNWAESGITPAKRNAFYCGTGWRGSEAFFNAWLMGWPRISVYDGGWFEWSNAGNPYETGIPKSK